MHIHWHLSSTFEVHKKLWPVGEGGGSQDSERNLRYASENKRELEKEPNLRGCACSIRKTLSLLFILFLLAASRKSTDSGKYHLLEKRNPFYFLAYFFYFLATFFTFQLTFT